MKEIKTWDLFDTLYYIDPEYKDSMEQKYHGDIPYKEYLQIREEAEISLHGTSYNINDIEHILNTRGIYGTMKLEQDLMIESLRPIKENISKVKPGDLILSDSPYEREKLLHLIPTGVNFVTTSEGKRRGYIFEELKKHYDIILHTGDNQLTDIGSAASKGIKTKKSVVHNRTSLENRICKFDEEVSNILYNLRLGNFDEDYYKRKLQLLQNINILLLKYFSNRINDYVNNKNIERILYSARDCRNLHYLASKHNTKTSNYYFYTSRTARKKASESYVEYTKSLTSNKALIVDLDGTGWSLRHLKTKMSEKFDVDNIDIFLFHKVNEYMERPSKVKDYEIEKVFSGCKFQHNRFELINQADHPMTEDVVMIEDNPSVIFSDLQDENTRELIQFSFDYFKGILPDINPDLDFSKNVAEILYEELSNPYFDDVLDMIGENQKQEEVVIDSYLRS